MLSIADSNLESGAMQRRVVLSSVCAVAVVEGVPLVVSSQKTSDGLQERPRACDTSRYLSRNGLEHKQALVQKWPYACTKTGASTGLALFDKQDQVVVGSHGQRASSCRTRGGRAQPGIPGCSSLMSAAPKTSERKRKGSKTR